MMAGNMENAHKHFENEVKDAEKVKIGIVVSRWNDHITNALLEGSKETLIEQGIKAENIEVIYVPGSFELPYGARLLLSNGSKDAIICLGCVIKGETDHDVYINYSTALGIQQLSLSSGKPVVFGVLTPNNEQQALDRAGGRLGNKGIEAALTVLSLVGLNQKYKNTKSTIGFS
ncbi:MAG TPA: 6,7-dimethyl-8-ribityllumazine synthase [Saprospiraceae bacterium]|nr:6,7-dimethyl-8-ribityllumazine synthase [Saprospiraceae bacterium]